MRILNAPFRCAMVIAASVVCLAGAESAALDPDTEDAIRFFEAGYWHTGFGKARNGADRNNDEIQFWMGHCLENGLGGAVKDVFRARAWYEKSAAQGNAKARGALARLDGKSNENAEAERKAREEEERRKAESERKAREEEEKRHQAGKRSVEALQARIEAELRRVATEREKAKKPGYRFDETLGNAVWTPGKAHPRHPNVVASDKEGIWRPADGYGWVDENDKDNFEVRKKPRATVRLISKITLPADMTAETRAMLALSIAKAALEDLEDRANPEVKPAFGMFALISFSSPEGLQNAKSIASKAFKESGPVPDLAAASTADEQRAVIFMEMLQSFTKDGIDLEQRLNRIDSVLESKGSRIHKTGELGKCWQEILRNSGNRVDDIRRPPPKYA